MSVLDDAIILEERAQIQYRDAAARLGDPSAKGILEFLSGEETKHAAALRAMKRGLYEGLAAFSLGEARGLVEGALRDGRSTLSADASLRDVLRQAMEMERATERFYKERGRGLEDQKLVELFLDLAAQEEGHYLFASSLLRYFDRPAEWVESAEFGPRPDY